MVIAGFVGVGSAGNVIHGEGRAASVPIDVLGDGALAAPIRQTGTRTVGPGAPASRDRGVGDQVIAGIVNGMVGQIFSA